MNTQSLDARLTTLIDAHKTTVQLIQRLATLNFQPGSTPLAGEEGDVRVELSRDIHESLKEQEEELELLRQEVEDFTSASSAPSRGKDSEKSREKSQVRIRLARLAEDLKQSRSQFRKAQLQAKRNAEQAKDKERELLFAGIQDSGSAPSAGRRRGQQNLTKDELELNASSDVTVALQRTHQLMQSELSRSHFAQETLDQSTAALAELSEKYSSLDDLLSSSKQLLTTLLRSQKSDTWYLQTALYILACTIAWLIYRRFLYGPLWWLVWLPLKLTYRLFFGILAAAGVTGGSSSASQVQTSTSRSLIVKPSATGRPPPFPKMADRPQGVPVGGGGYGAKVGPHGESFDQQNQQQLAEHEKKQQQQGKDPSAEGSLSQQVGQMAEQSQQQQGGDLPEGAIVRGDGTVLLPRGSEQPVNPKKKTMDVPVGQEKDEL